MICSCCRRTIHYEMYDAGESDHFEGLRCIPCWPRGKKQTIKFRQTHRPKLSKAEQKNKQSRKGRHDKARRKSYAG